MKLSAYHLTSLSLYPVDGHCAVVVLFLLLLFVVVVVVVVVVVRNGI